MFNLVNLLCLAALTGVAFGAITPTSPDSNTVVTVGSDIKALWAADSTGEWNNVEIQLMTGDNLQMVPLAVLATGIDGTSTTGLDIPCPDVSPYSKIYFLQFTRGGDVSTSTWTTRFTIAGSDGSTTPPTNSTNYSGTQVEWGTGALVGQAPSVITGAEGSSSNSTMSSSNSTDSTAPSASMASIAQASMSSASEEVVAAASSTSKSASMSAKTSAGASRASAAAASSSGAAYRRSSVGLGAIVLGLAGVVAL